MPSSDLCFDENDDELSDDDVDQIEGFPSNSLDVGIEGKPELIKGPLDVGLEEEMPRIIDGLSCDPLDVPVVGHGENPLVEGSPSNPINESASLDKATMEKAQEKMPLDSGSEAMSGLVRCSFYNPFDLPEKGRNGVDAVVEGSLSDPVDGSMSIDKADMQKKRQSSHMDASL